MRGAGKGTDTHRSGQGITKSLLLTLPMAVVTAFMLMGPEGPPQEPLRVIPLILTFLFVNATFFLMIHTGRTDRYRAVVFVAMAVFFVIGFVANLIEVRGSMALTSEDMLSGETPFCHMVIPMTIIPAALTRTIIFPGSIVEGFASIAGMFVIWIGVSLALGRGFCSWGCFFGGLEDGFSRLRRKAVIRKIPGKWTYLPFGILAAVVLISAVTLSPTYCEWLCPFKTVTEFEAVTSFKVLIQTVIFVSLFIALVIVLPILTRKRTQCGLFCPMGAFQSFTNRVTPVEVRIDREKCRDCMRCEKVCPTFSIDADSIARGTTRNTCTRCGKCIDECPHGAISYHVKGTSPAAAGERARMLFIYPAFLFLAIFGGGMIQDGIYRVLLFITTGSMIV